MASRRVRGTYLPRWAERPLGEAYRRVRAIRVRGLPPLLETSVPKAGTHLLSMLLLEFGYRMDANQPFNPNVLLDYDAEGLRPAMRRLLPGEFVVEHLAWSAGVERVLREEGAKAAFVYRDPRAAAVSFAHYAATMNPAHRLHAFFKSLPDLDARVMAVLDGVPDAASANGVGRPPLGEMYDAFAPWRTSPLACPLAFEDLVGPQGGGSEDRRLAAVGRLAAFLGIGLGRDGMGARADRIFDRASVTFRSGQCEAWRGEVSERTLASLNERLGGRLADWGYPP